MHQLLQVCVYNENPDDSADLAAAIGSLNFVRLAGEVTNADELASALQETTINLVLFNLDPDPEPVLTVIDNVSAKHTDVALMATGSKADPEAILAPMRAGCDQYVCKPIDHSDLAAAVSRVAAKRFAVQHKPRVVVVSGAGGGVGTTSIASSLAMEIARSTERPCALIDLDLQFGDIALNFDEDPSFTVYDMAVAGTDLDTAVLQSAVCELDCGVAILARPNQIEEAASVNADAVYRILHVIMELYENIVIDTPHDITPVTTAALTHADVVFVVAQLLVPGVRNAKRYRDALINLGVPEEKIEFLVNRAGSRSDGRLSLDDFEDSLNKKPFGTIPNDYQFVARSIDFGRPISSLDQSNPVRKAIFKIARRITHPDSEQAKDTGSGGFLRRLLTK